MKILGSALLALAFAIPAFGQGCVGTPSVITFRVQENVNGQVRGVPYATIVIMKLNAEGHIEKTSEYRANYFGYYKTHLGPCRSMYHFGVRGVKRRLWFETEWFYNYEPDGIPQTISFTPLT